MKERITELKKFNRPLICIEWMARPLGSNFATELPLFKTQKVAAYRW